MHNQFTKSSSAVVEQAAGKQFIKYRVEYVDACGSKNAALMASYALYMNDHHSDGQGWFTLTIPQWNSSLHLTRDEQEKAREKLRNTSFWEERHEKLGGKQERVWYRIDCTQFAKALQQSEEKPHTQDFESAGKPHSEYEEIPHTSKRKSRTLGAERVRESRMYIDGAIKEDNKRIIEEEASLSLPPSNFDNPDCSKENPPIDNAYHEYLGRDIRESDAIDLQNTLRKVIVPITEREIIQVMETSRREYEQMKGRSPNDIVPFEIHLRRYIQSVYGKQGWNDPTYSRGTAAANGTRGAAGMHSPTPAAVGAVAMGYDDPFADD